MTLLYAGIGSRRTPPDVCLLMTKLAGELAVRDYVLRSGGAEGADKAFEAGAGDKKEIFRAKPPPSPEAYRVAAAVHPAWHRCSPAAKALHARNTYQILGRSLDSPVRFVVCWTPDGAEEGTSQKTGGTGQAIRIANRLDIPVFNLQRSTALKRLVEFL
jgi:hypothetical protein